MTDYVFFFPAALDYAIPVTSSSAYFQNWSKGLNDPEESENINDTIANANITKTSLFKYTENFIIIKLKIFR